MSSLLSRKNSNIKCHKILKEFTTQCHHFFEDCTLPHVSYWTPPDSTEFRRTCHPDFLGVTRAKLAFFVWRSPAESGILGRSPRNSVIFFCWTSPAESNRISTGQESWRVHWNPLDSIHRNPLDSLLINLDITCKKLSIPGIEPTTV